MISVGLLGSGIVGMAGGIAIQRYFGPTVRVHASNDLQVAYAFSKGHALSPLALLLGVIDETKAKLDIAVYTLTHGKITKHILNAKNRGVDVRIITDGSQIRHDNQRLALNRLVQAGIPVIYSRVDDSGTMHLKLCISDENVVTSGSFNYTYPAVNTNDEVLTLIRNPSIANEWGKRFEQMWTDKARFQSYDPIRGVVKYRKS